MKHPLFISLALTAGLMVPALAQTPAAPATAAAATPQANRVMGTVDTSKAPSYTVTGRNGTATPFTLDPNVKVTKVTPATQNDLAANDWVTVNGTLTGQDTAAPAITANNIRILAEEPRGGRKGAKAGFHRNGADGQVVTTSPLTIKTAGGVTVAVTLNATPMARFEKVAAAATSDITNGENIQARLKNGVATNVTILPARQRRGRRAAK